MLMLMRTVFILVGLSLTATACAGGDELRQVRADASPETTASTSSASGVPEEFRAACGQPGSRVVTERLEVRIKHSDCDLTGVTIVNQGRGAVVPEPGTGVANSSGVTIDVDAATGDVTFTAEAEVPQY